MIALPSPLTNEGVEVRIYLTECRGPLYSSYTIEQATECMKLMKAVLYNRLKDPKPYLAPGANNLVAIVKARGQFAGFGLYPTLESSLNARIQAILNNAEGNTSMSAPCAEFLNAALEIAKDPSYNDPSPGTLVAWRTQGHGSPGDNFSLYKSILRNSFFYI